MDNTCTKAAEENSRVIDRIYNHEFVMDELNAAIEKCANDEFIFAHEREEFIGHCRHLKEIINARFISDIKEILHMA